MNGLSEIPGLCDRWMRLCARLVQPAGATPTNTDNTAASLATVLDALYHHPPRAYHGLHHIAACLTVLDRYRSLASDADLVELALWFHDAVYDAVCKDNERQSADIACLVAALLGLDAGRIERLHALIMVTTHSGITLTGDQALIADIDMSFLASPWEDFQRDSARIREEYAFATQDQFNRGRAAFLESLLKRPVIYHLSEFRTSLEAPARSNLERSIRELRAASPE